MVDLRILKFVDAVATNQRMVDGNGDGKCNENIVRRRDCQKTIALPLQMKTTKSARNGILAA